MKTCENCKWHAYNKDAKNPHYCMKGVEPYQCPKEYICDRWEEEEDKYDFHATWLEGRNTNLQKIQSLTQLEFAIFICRKAEDIYKRFTCSEIGFALWLEQAEDKDFWQRFEDYMQKL